MKVEVFVGGSGKFRVLDLEVGGKLTHKVWKDQKGFEAAVRAAVEKKTPAPSLKGGHRYFVNI